MKFTLTDYQQTAVAELYTEIEDGWEAYGKRKKLTAVALSAPTSAGKTIIASAQPTPDRSRISARAAGCGRRRTMRWGRVICGAVRCWCAPRTPSNVGSTYHRHHG